MKEETSIELAKEERETQKIEEYDIKKMIYTIRGKQVMLDSDVATLYNCETRAINQTVKRNIKRFPTEFCFKLTDSETLNLKSQFVISSLESKNNNYGGRRKIPFVFTEQGVAMLSGLLKSDTAIHVSINIMKAFVEMRKFLYENKQVFDRITTLEYKQLENEKNFDKVFNVLQSKENITQKLFFNGQIYDAYNLIVKIIKKANDKILIIDNYIDDTILEMLTKKKQNVEVVILTSNKSSISNLDIQKFNKEYPILKVAKTNKFHDRFIIIDNKELYHCGASLKDLGKKCFGINKIEDNEYIEQLKQRII